MTAPPIDAISSVQPAVAVGGLGGVSAVKAPSSADSAAAVAPASAVASDPNAGIDHGSESAKALEAALNERIARLLSTNLRLRIDKDRDTGHFVYQSINIETGELHRQFPSAEILRLLAFFKELDGLLFDGEA